MIVLETERMYFRKWVPDDWKRFKPLVTDPQVIKYVHQGGPWADDRIEQRVHEYIQYGETRGWQLWPVIHRSDAKLIGFCGFSDGFLPDVEIGWRLLPEYWGQGLATEAARAALDYGFQTWNFPRVIAVAKPVNRASIRVMEKIGMTYDDTVDCRGAEVVRYAVDNPRQLRHTATPRPSCRVATAQDIPMLAHMNRQLIEDEASRNPMSLAELEDRMRSWLAEDWQAVIIEQNGTLVGYGLFQFRSDEYDPHATMVYLRQFFVAREHRGQGIGRAALEQLFESFFPQDSTIVLDVLELNPGARRFWKSTGFQPYCTTMKREPESSEPATRREVCDD